MYTQTEHILGVNSVLYRMAVKMDDEQKGRPQRRLRSQDGRSKLTEDQVRQIRADATIMKYKDVAEKHAVSVGTVTNIVSGLNYRWVS